MSSWQTEQDCPCYQFMLIDGKGEFKQTINHNYSLSVKLKDSEEIMSFNKTITMNSTVVHELKDWAVVNTGSVDDLLADLPAITSRTEGMPWLQLHGFTGNYDNLSVTIDNNGETLTISTSPNTWNGTVDEAIAATYGTLNFANINLNAIHISKEITTAESGATSTSPMGFRQVATDGEGWATRWLDYVAFVDYEVNQRTNIEDVVKIGNTEIRNIELGEEVSNTYNISDSVVPYGTDVRYWEPIYPPTDSESDGRYLGFSHWLFNTIIPSRWTWFRDLVDAIWLGEDTVDSSLVNNADIVGNWQGSISKSRLVDDKEYVMLSSDKIDAKFYEYTSGTVVEIERPEGLEDKIYPICPL